VFIIVSMKDDGAVDVVFGAFYGDEGKGAIADYLLHRGDYGAVVRFQGGNNAGHTLTIKDEVYKLHILPCGIVQEETLAVIGPGCVVDPEILLGELDGLSARAIDVSGLRLSDIAHVIMPYHRALDYIEEAKRSLEEKIGSTCRGISPAYSDKINRRGIRIQDLLDKDALAKKVAYLMDHGLRARLGEADLLDLPDEALPFIEMSLDEDNLIERYLELGNKLKVYITDTSHLLWDLLDSGENVLAEGAQGIFLDIDYGSYPFVTSSSIVPGAVNTGSGIPVSCTRDIYGVLKAFGTRIDTVGPFPTFEKSERADLVIERGGEFGTTTGRRRRFGWLDLVAARYATRLSGMNRLALTKIDGLADIGDIPVCVAYEIDGITTKDYPSSFRDLARAKPIYETLPGWSGDLSGARTLSDLPEQARDYLFFIRDYLAVDLSIIGVGPAREETIFLES
jgi:adenylosuccinate synthase